MLALRGRIVPLSAGVAALAAALAATVLLAPGASAATTVTVAADGSGNYTTVQAAVNAVAAGSSTINIKPGTYRGVVTIPSGKSALTLAGTGGSASQVVIVEGHAAGPDRTPAAAPTARPAARRSPSTPTTSRSGT